MASLENFDSSADPKHTALLSEQLQRALQPADAPQFVAQVMARTHNEPAPQAAWIRGLTWGSAALCVLLAIGLGTQMAGQAVRESSAPMARGGPVSLAQQVGVEVFRHPGGNTGARLALHDNATFASGDGLSFSLINRASKEVHVQLFALDARHDQVWFYPEEDAAKQHRSVTLGPKANFALPDGITLDDLPAGTLHIVALFSDTSLSITQTADALSKKDGSIASLSALPHVFSVQTLNLQVTDK